MWRLCHLWVCYLFIYLISHFDDQSSVLSVDLFVCFSWFIVPILRSGLDLGADAVPAPDKSRPVFAHARKTCGPVRLPEYVFLPYYLNSWSSSLPHPVGRVWQWKKDRPPWYLIGLSSSWWQEARSSSSDTCHFMRPRDRFAISCSTKLSSGTQSIYTVHNVVQTTVASHCYAILYILMARNTIEPQ